MRGKSERSSGTFPRNEITAVFRMWAQPGLCSKKIKMEEGYVKFNAHWIRREIVPPAALGELDIWRTRLHKLGLVGMYPDGIGFGNLSLRVSKISFLITGTQTGHLEELGAAGYTLVTDYDFTANSLTCRGPVKASSESLTHAALYAASPQVQTVMHVHSAKLWDELINRVPTSAEEFAYGTPELAQEVQRLYAETDLPQKKILVLAGHQDGLISFGANAGEAGETLLKFL